MEELPELKHYRTEIYTIDLGIAGDVICATQDWQRNYLYIIAKQYRLRMRNFHR